MDEELKQRLLKYLDTMEEGVGQSAEFIADQAPDVVQQWLAWEFWSAICGIFLSIALIVVVVVTVKFFWRVSKSFDDNDAREVSRFVVACLAAAGVFCCVGAICVDIRQAVKVSVAPKVVIVEKIADMAKSLK